MKTVFLFVSLCLLGLLGSPAQGAVRTSGAYSQITEAVDSGGGAPISAGYTQSSTSIGLTLGVQTSAAYSQQAGFVPQTVQSSAGEIAVFDGTAPPAGERTDNVGTVDFGTVNTGSSSAAQTFTIQNFGTATADLTGLAVTSTNAAEFTFTAPLVTTLAPGATTTFTVTFSPSGTGARSGVINLASNDADENPFEIAVTGTGVVPAPTVTPSTANLSTTATTLTITGTNFSPTPGENAVVFSPAGTGTVTASTATTLTVTGLTGHTLGALNAVVTTNGQSSGAAVQVATVVAAPGDLDPLDLNIVGFFVLATAVQPDGKTIIGGQFSSVLGVARNNIARLNADGTLDTGFDPNANSRVYSVAVQPDGKTIIGGQFSSVLGVARKNIARLNADGTLDTGFDPNANNSVHNVVVQADGQILLGGDFTTVGGTARNRIARVAPNGTLDAGFNPNASSRVQCVAVQADGRILLGGDFTTVGGTARNYIARVAANGTLDAGFNPNASSSVRSVAVQADGQILLGGEFNTVGGTARRGIARVAANGTLDVGFDPNTSSRVYSVALQADGQILLGGDFTTVGGTARNKFARLVNDPATQSLTSPSSSRVQWLRGGSSPEVEPVTFELSTDGGTNYSALGAGTRIPGGWERTGLTLPASGQLRARGRTTSGDSNGSGGLVETVAPFVPTPTVTLSTSNLPTTATTLTITGTNFSTTPGENSVAFTPAGTGTVTASTATTLTVTGLSGLTLGALNAVVTTNGQSSGAPVQVATVVAPVPGDLDPLDLGVGGAYLMGAAVQPDGKTILVGNFRSVLGVPRNNIARLNVDGSLDLGFDPNSPQEISSVAVQPDGKIVISGNFISLQPNGAGSATPIHRVARLNPDGTLDASFDPNANGFVRSVEVQADGKILLVGDFTTLQPSGGSIVTRNRVARMNADGTLDAGFDPDANGLVYAVTVQADGKILIGGNFTSLQPNGAASATTRNYIARLNADGTLDTDFDPNADNRIRSMVVQGDGRILLGGSFTSLQPNGAASATTRNHIARLNADGTLDTGFDPSANADVDSLTVQANGKVLLGGAFTSLQPNGAGSATVRNYVARVNADGTLDPVFDPKADNVVFGVALQADGKVLLMGNFTTLQPNGAASPTQRESFARLINEPAVESLSAVNTSLVSWTRSGSAPDVSDVTIESSTDGGANWTPLGSATRVGGTSHWQLTGQSLPAAGQLRAQGRTSGGYYGGSSGLVNAEASYNGLLPAGTEDPLWSQITGSSGVNDLAEAVTMDSVGNVIVTGYVNNPVNNDYYTAKYSAADGSLLWEQRYNAPDNRSDQSRAVAVDAAGNVVITGGSMNAVNEDFYTVKYAAADGSVLWEKRYNGPADRLDSGRMVVVDGNGDVIVVGDSFNSSGNSDAYTAKYAAADGSLLWERRYDGPANNTDQGRAVAVDGSGNVVISGSSSNGTNLDFYTAKYAAADGSLLWERRYNGPANDSDSASNVVLDGSGNVIVTGNSNNSSNSDALTVKYAAADGATLWEVRYNGPADNSDVSSDVAVDSLGNVVVTGYAHNGSNEDYRTAKYAAATGALLWETIYNGPANGLDIPQAVEVNGGNEVVVTGHSFATGADLDYYTARYAGLDGSLVSEARYNSPSGRGDQPRAGYRCLAIGPGDRIAVTGTAVSTAGDLDMATVVYGSAVEAEIVVYDGNGTGGAERTDNIGTHAFGSVNTGTSTSAQTFTIQNLGTATADLTGIAVTSSNPAEFVVGTTATAAVLAPSETTSFTVTFSPSAGGLRTGVIEITSNDADEDPFEIQVSGTGVVPTPEIVVEQPVANALTDGVSSANFGSVTSGGSGSPVLFTIRNEGAASLTIGTVQTVGGDALNFQVDTTGMLSSLSPWQSTTFRVRFSPSAEGTRTTNLQISNNDANEHPFDIALTGEGLAPGASDPVIAVDAGGLAASDGSGAQVDGEPAGTTFYAFNGAQAINESGESAGTTIVRDSGGGLRHALVAGNPPQVVASSSTDLSGTGLPVGTTPLNFRDPLINSDGHVAYIGDIQGVGFNRYNRRCIFTNVPDGVLKLVARQGDSDPTTGTNFKNPLAVSLAGQSVIFMAQTDDNQTGIYAWDNVNGVTLLARTGDTVLAGGGNKTILQIVGLQTNAASSGQSEEHVKTTGDDVRINVMLKFTDTTQGILKGTFNQATSAYTGFTATYVENGRLADAYAGANAVVPGARMRTFVSPGWDQGGTYYGMVSYLLANVGGVNSYNDCGVLVDLSPGELVMQTREGEVAPGTGGVAVFKDFYDVMVGAGDWEYLVKADVRGTGVTGNNNDGLWAKHATNGLTLVVREGDEPPGVPGGAFRLFLKYALPGNGAPFFGATLVTGVGGVTAANDAGLWAMSSSGELKKVMREGDVINVSGTDRTVQTILSLENNSSGAIGSRIYTSDGSMKILVKFTDGLQAIVDVTVP